MYNDQLTILLLYNVAKLLSVQLLSWVVFLLSFYFEIKRFSVGFADKFLCSTNDIISEKPRPQTLHSSRYQTYIKIL